MNERLMVAVRALSCINEHSRPDAQDIASLRGWVDLRDSGADDDELARIVIDAEIHVKENSVLLVKPAAAGA